MAIAERAISGQFSSDGRYWIELWVWVNWQSYSENYSNITWEVRAVKVSGDGKHSGATPGTNWSASVDGYVGGASNFGYDFRPAGRQTRVWGRGDKNIWHDWHGGKRINLSVSSTIVNTLAIGSASASVDWDLPRIPKPPAPPSITSLSHITASNVRVNGTVPDNMGAGIDAYGFEFATNSSFTGSSSVTHNGQILDITNLAPNTTYWFRMSAHNSQGWGGNSNTMAATTLGHPSTPAAPTVTPSTTVTGRVALTWPTPATTGAGGITGYNIFRDGVQIASTTGTGTSYVDNGRTPYSWYAYSVAARNAYSDSVGATSPRSPQTTVIAPGPPSAPRDLTVVADAGIPGKANLTWTAPVNVGAGGVTGYRIRLSEGTLIANQNGTATSYDVTGLNPGQTYTFKVSARNALSDAEGSEGAFSNHATVTPIGEPTAPTNVTVVPSTTVSNRLVISWTPPPGTLSGFSIFRKINGASTLLGKINASHTSFTVDNLTPGQTYTYAVRARTSYTDTLPDGYPGNWGGPASADNSGVPSSNNAQTVPNLTAVASGTNAVLSGTYTINAVTANTLSYAKVADNIPSAASGGSIANNTNAIFNGTHTITSVAPNAFTFPRTASNVLTLATSGGTVTNNTNTLFNGTYTVTDVNIGANLISYANTGADVTARSVPVNNAPGNFGKVTNLSNVVFNGTGKVITAITPTTISYAQTGTAVAESNAAGTITNVTNRDIFNGEHTVTSIPTFNIVRYSRTAANIPERTWALPNGTVSRVNSPALLDIKYRSGWAG